MPGGKVHWFSIMNSCLVVLVMASLVALILIRTVRRDLARYEQARGSYMTLRIQFHDDFAIDHDDLPARVLRRICCGYSVP